ncbi:precorrin-3B synthase [Pseudanabaena sp. FACHB-1998]|uniref:precorrin-3B synthase n=1 Tax=Pseudanabaena sp. FACHB-1998 TaxID=2692858 RepID=UPI001680CBCC|nr:precorrin-3B synthase [Pseudanabaena sp. FACHB-1998]MBD2176602.1 precorrin-3B synthase [Pseudanabaena sp. FACHB-1998]
MQSTTAICPSLFNATTAQDGILSRIRLPAGLITSTQCEVLTQVVNKFGNGEIQITNRANLQIRTSQALPEEVLLDFQDYGLASSTQSTDGLRNLMASPSAGIDVHAKLNTIPLVKAWNFYLLQHPELAILSNKFSVCFDGGEAIRVSDRPNDICLVAVEVDQEIYFDLHLGLGDRGDSPVSVNVLISQNQVLEVLAALTEVYRQYTQQQLNQKIYLRSRPPRLRDLIHDWGMEKYLALVVEKLGYTLKPSPLAPLPLGERGTRSLEACEHLGIHPQKQSGLFYIGVVVPLGRLTSQQLAGLARLAKQSGGGALRLTPWQNLLITDIAEVDLEQVTQEILNLGLYISANHPYAAIAACSGYKGCKSAFTDTQADAKAIASHLEKCIQLDYPINLHFSGCDKSCAQHHASDIALVGKDSESYQIYVGDYVGDGEINFGRELYAEYAAHELPHLMERLINIYQTQRQNPDQSFREFVNQCDLQELREVISHA